MNNAILRSNLNSSEDPAAYGKFVLYFTLLLFCLHLRKILLASTFCLFTFCLFTFCLFTVEKYYTYVL